MSVLFDRRRMQDQDEMVLSVMFAVREAQRVPMFLIREGDDIALKAWREHSEKPVVVGKNMYDSLLRSITRGTVGFPIPKEVLESLPENYIVPADIDDILWPLLRLSKYVPARVMYESKAKGVFVECEKLATASSREFNGIPTLPFPEELNDVSLISFELAQCWNSTNKAVQTWFALSDYIVADAGEAKRSDIEEVIGGYLSRRDHDIDLERMRGEEINSMIEHQGRRLAEAAGISVKVTEEAFLALQSAKTIRDTLWRWSSE